MRPLGEYALIGLLLVGLWAVFELPMPYNLLVPLASLLLVATILGIRGLVHRRRERAEERVRQQAEAERAAEELCALEERCHAEHTANNGFRSLLHAETAQGWWKRNPLHSIPHFMYGRADGLLMLNGKIVGHYLLQGSVREYALTDDFSIITGKVPEVMVMEATWTDHEVKQAIPGDSYFVAKAEGVERHEFYLLWNGLPRWRCLGWDEKGVILKDLFSKVITLPTGDDVITRVLGFVTTFDSLDSYALVSIANRAIPAIVEAAPNPGLRLVRIALTLRGDALDGRPLTDESWNDLVNRDPSRV